VSSVSASAGKATRIPWDTIRPVIIDHGAALLIARRDGVKGW
jgi:hypothetical protein